MCGIVASLFEAPRRERLEAALAALTHRGPDGEGLWLGDDVALGHRRLAIIAPERGAQPLFSEDRQIVAVVNGELYDHERLRRQLEDEGHVFATESDSALLVHLYERDGLGCLASLRGEFAFVLWDARRRRLFAARDRFGVKPLLYSRAPGPLYLASEAKALFALGVAPRWDEAGMCHAVHHQYLPPGRTLFQGVAQLPPGHYLLAERGQRKVERYWSLDFPRQPATTAPPEELEEQLAARLDEAVRLRLRADVPLGAYLSGGLDSSLVAALASRHSPRPLPCFCISFAHAPYDERHAAERVARHLDAPLHLVELSQDRLLELLPEAVTMSEGLAIGGQLPAKLALARAAREAGVKAVLVGEGADELLGGYPHLLMDFRRAAGLSACSHGDTISSGVMVPSARAPHLPQVVALLGAVPSFLSAKAAFGATLAELLRPEVRETWAKRDPFAALLAEVGVEANLEGRHPVDQAAWLWSQLALGRYILETLGDGTEMAASLEGRVPFLDHTVAELCCQIPVEQKIRPVESAHDGDELMAKAVLRNVAKPLLPTETQRRVKQPLLAPPVTVFSGSHGKDWIGDMLASEAFCAQPFFQPAAARRWWHSLEGRGDRASLQGAEAALMTMVTAALLGDNLGLGDPSGWRQPTTETP